MHTINAATVAPIASDAPRAPLRRLEAHKGLVTWIGIFLLPIIAVGTGQILHNTLPAAEAPVAQIGSIAWPRGTARPSATRSAASGSIAPVDSLVEGLVRRLEDEPGDAKGWALLAQSYAFLGAAERAESALATAVALGLDETDLRRRLQAARSGGGEAQPAISSVTPVIRGVVSFAGDVAPSLPREARLFVTAKAMDGSPMPVAVLAMEAPRFPFEFALGDEHSMLPGVALRQFAELAVSARISRSGTAARDPSDIESTVQTVNITDAPIVELVITPR